MPDSQSWRVVIATVDRHGRPKIVGEWKPRRRRLGVAATLERFRRSRIIWNWTASRSDARVGLARVPVELLPRKLGRPFKERPPDAERC